MKKTSKMHAIYGVTYATVGEWKIFDFSKKTFPFVVFLCEYNIPLSTVTLPQPSP